MPHKNVSFSGGRRTKTPAFYSSLSGLTLIEILAAVAITALVTGILITYSSASRQQISLMSETAKIVQITSRAKARSISTFVDPAAPCGYGVSVDIPGRAYHLAGYRISPSCESVFQGGAFSISEVNVLETFFLPPGLVFADGAGALEHVLFVPPDPQTVIQTGGLASTAVTGNIYLQTADGQGERRISINSSGQINY